MTDTARLEYCFLPLDRRTPPKAYFFRIIGRDAQGKILALLADYYQRTQTNGVYIRDRIANPTEPETARFLSAAGAQFTLSRPLAERHMTVWLGQLRPAQRQLLTSAVLDTLELLRKQGANDNIIKNAYIKFMCWFRAPLGRVLVGIGKPTPPKILFEGTISKYEVLLLHLLHQAGCDVWYVNFSSENAYRKADPSGGFSRLVQGELFTPPSVPLFAAPNAANRQMQPPKPVSPPVLAPREKPGQEAVLNNWVDGHPIWEAVLLPRSQRGTQSPPRLWVLFAACFGADERGTYRNRLLQLKRALDNSPKQWVLIDQKVQAPSVAETAPFRAVDKNLPRPSLICSLADRLTPACDQAQRLLSQHAFIQIMERHPEQNLVRLFNHGVRLACWLWRYVELLFLGKNKDHPPALVFYGSISEAEITLLWALAQIGADVLYFSPDKGQQQNFSRHFLPHLWMEVVLEESLPMEPFPQRDEKLRSGTTAYNASRELDQLLYSDTGMFRDRQFVRSQPVTLKTTYDEVGQLWSEDAQFRPSFRTEGGVVYVPNLFSKISGVDKGDVTLYWNRLRDMVTDNTYLITSVPFLQVSGPSMNMSQARSFIHQGRLDPKALKASNYYHYGYLPDDTQDYILEKIQALIDYDLILSGGSELPASVLSVLMNLDKELLQLLQNFDFTRSIPKVLIVDVTENMFTLDECILLSFLNLVGFDIAVFTPTGYRNLESHVRPEHFDTLTVGEFRFDLTVPALRRRGSGKNTGGWLGRLFGGSS